jgi:hypothetical protein
LPLRKFKVQQQKAVMRKKHRIAQLVEFYTQRTLQAKEKGETYMPELSVKSLEVMVRYKYPRLSEITRTQYAQELYSILKQNPNKRFLREAQRKFRSHW